MHHSISRFLLFLGAELMFPLASVAVIIPIGLSVMRNQTIKNSILFWLSVSMVLVSDLFLFLFIWILTSENYLSLFVFLLVITLALILFVELLWLLVGSQNVPWVAKALWAGYEFQKRAPAFQKAMQLLSSITVLIIFPLYIGLGFFKHSMSQEEWVKYVFRASLILLFAAPQLLFLPQNLFVLVSQNVSGDTRSRIFIGQLSNAISLLVLGSLFIWAVGGAGTTLPVLGNSFVFSPAILYATLIYVTVLIFVPYLIGHYRAKDWGAHLEAERARVVDELSNGLISPNPARVDAALADAERSVGENIHEIENSKSMRPAHEIQNSEKPTDLIYKVALKETLDSDPRFVHIKILHDIGNQVNECRALLSAESRERRKREIAAAYVPVLNRLIQHKEAPGVRPWVLAALTAAFMALMNPFLTSAGKFVAGRLGIHVEEK